MREFRPCRCEHSRSYHRNRNNEYFECFANPLLKAPCRCSQYREEPVPVIKGYCIYCKGTELDMNDRWVCVDCSELLRGRQ